VQFDHDGDFEADGFEVVATSGGSFEYDPRTTDGSFDEELGTKLLTYRVVGIDGSSEPTGWFTPWNVFAFQLTDDPGAGPPRVKDLRLERDTGADPTDKSTAFPAVLGAIV